MSETVHSFTTTVPRWQPYVVPVDLETATEEQILRHALRTAAEPRSEARKEMR